MTTQYEILFAVSVVLCIYLSKSSFTSKQQVPVGFRTFQVKYLSVLVLVEFADWLQGSYHYAWYKSVGFNLNSIGLLYVVGFSSSAVFGTIVGSLADKFGRKRGCQLFCILYGLSCYTKQYPTFEFAVAGRVLGGISTSLLFSVFESWMVTAHNSFAFAPALLEDTFAWSTFLNGLSAILSGISAHFVVARAGLIGPFMLAGATTVLACLLIGKLWDENYGAPSNPKASKQSKATLGDVYEIFRNGMHH